MKTEKVSQEKKNSHGEIKSLTAKEKVSQRNKSQNKKVS